MKRRILPPLVLMTHKSLKWRYILLTILFLLSTIYFGSYAFFGDAGYVVLLSQRQIFDDLGLELSQKEAQEVLYENKIDRLHEETLDLDLLDQKTRSVLNFSKPDDSIIVSPRQDDDMP